jgi:RNA polymerase sigma-70 factor, ECF subfamily
MMNHMLNERSLNLADTQAADSAAQLDAAFRRALGRLLPELTVRAQRLTREHALADDVVQDTCERALKFRAQYQQGTNLRAWLHQILFSVFVTRYRKTTRERNALRKMCVDPVAWSCESRFAAPDQTLPLPPVIAAVFAGIPCVFRDAVAKVDLEDWSYQDAADQLHVPVGTVMSRLHRGRKLLRERLVNEASTTSSRMSAAA